LTSEICVMNRRSLVLAADSAATVSRWEQGRKQERYYKGSNKIFQLSNQQPIGIMIYDSADLYGLTLAIRREQAAARWRMGLAA
jgi:hypothetical protein